jgi:hypothetical protein
MRDVQWLEGVLRMIQYPGSFASISDEEMEYTTGGATSVGLVCSLAATIVTLGTIFDVRAIKEDLRKQNPDKDNSLLTIDAYNVYMEKPYGLLMMISSTALACAGLIL